jgi:hypothetical protein
MNDHKKCPVPGCNHIFTLGSVGWFKHVQSPQTHPYWLADVTDPAARVDAFRAEFPEFFPKPKPVSGTHALDLEAIKEKIEELRRALDTTALLIQRSQAKIVETRARIQKTG